VLTLLDMALARPGKAIKGSVFLTAWPSIDHNGDALSGVSLARLTGMIQFSISILPSRSRLARNNPARDPHLQILCRLSRSLLSDCSWSAYIGIAVACGGYGDKRTP
jgi:hypothetical protein